MNYPEPWPEPVDGAEIRNEVEAQVRRYVSLPDGGPEIITLYVQFTWVSSASQIAPRVLLTSPIPGCGKTRLMDVMWPLCREPQSNINVTPAALFRAIDEKQCTLFLDEADNWANQRGPVVSILNAGHTKDTAFVSRFIGGRLVHFNVYGPIVIAAIGRPFGEATLARCLTLRMQPRMPGEVLEKFRKDRTEDLKELARKLHRWGLDNMAALQVADPEIPAGLSDRGADNVRILLAIADLDRGGWPEKARRSAQIICAESEESHDGTAIIRDICAVFGDHEASKFRSADLVRGLVGRDPPHYRNLTPNALARRLDPFEIRPKELRFGPNNTPRGYERTQFDDAMERYAISLDDAPTPPARPTATSATPTQHVSEFMRCLPVAEAIFRTAERMIEAEAAANEGAVPPPPPPRAPPQLRLVED
jgi:hypothetical protein